MLFHSSTIVCPYENAGFSLVKRPSVLVLVVSIAICALAISLTSALAFAQQPQKSAQSELSNSQRLTVMRSKLESMRRSLESAIAGMNAQDTAAKKANPDDPRERLRGLNKEVVSIRGEV